MFSFHKPKIYRSALGCCICRAKSSSSRFTDSKKYEPEFARCFRILEEQRSGEICNACVLLVKRWKKLPPGTTRDWHHVVDARAGPGTKSVNKGKVKPPKRALKKHRSPAEKRCKMDHLSGGALSDDITIGDDSLSESSMPSPPESRAASPTPSNSSDDSGLLDEDEEERRRPPRGLCPSSSKHVRGSLGKRGGKKHRKPRGSVGHHRDSYVSSGRRVKNSSPPFRISSFLDMSFWRKEKVCCGIIFKGPHGEVLIYPKLLRPCRCRRRLAAKSVMVSDDVCSRTAPEAADPDTATLDLSDPATSDSPSLTMTLPTTPDDAAVALLFPTPEMSDCNLSSPDASEGLSRGSASPSGGSD